MIHSTAHICSVSKQSYTAHETDVIVSQPPMFAKSSVCKSGKFQSNIFFTMKSPKMKKKIQKGDPMHCSLSPMFG